MIGHERVTRWMAAFLGAVAVLLFPWALLVSAALPSRAVVRHWDLAWTGFDLALAAVLLVAAFAALRRRTWFPAAAAAAGTMLVCDAWFDVLTAPNRTELVVAGVEALAAELPLAGLCFLLVFVAAKRA